MLYNIFEDESFGKKGVLMNRNKEVVLKKKKGIGDFNYRVVWKYFYM